MPYTPHPVSPGMAIRWNRIFPHHDGRSFILPLDHGITHGVTPALADTRALVATGVSGGVDALLLRPGLMRALSGIELHGTGLIIALTGRLSRGVDHVALNTVEEAIRAGADAVAVELKLGSPGELDNVRTVSRLREEAHALGLPVLIMVYPVTDFVAKAGPAAHVHACRIGEELGGDFIKTAQPDQETLRACLDAVTVPLIMAGGGTNEYDAVRRRVEEAMKTGAKGAAVGRNIFGHPDPRQAITELVAAVHA